ncbi:UDP-glucosyltransferase 2-like [Maniola jurtina]|uniref:UDP-glucosyltransferase 2-like n=1 Tax=Maniola jurtina TaxID=191418 RepID=UPI001E68B068|nr:UDP-glucosyltransferase 2-like [Maniola jurtina]XP_045779380.1 UDP-glucosyltransferase 2-like [Maniola jurtina]
MFVSSKIAILLSVVANYCYGYRILVVFPVPGKSHSILGEGYVRHLLAAGHEVTYITPVPMKEPPPRLRQVDVSENLKYLAVDEMFDIKQLMTKLDNIQEYMPFHKAMENMMYQTYQLPVLQRFINDPKERYDVAVVEWLYSELSAGFSTVFNCPYIWASSMIPHTAVLSLIDTHVNPAYSVDHLSFHYTTTFWDRLEHWRFITKLTYYRWSTRNEFDEKMKNVFGAATVKRGNRLPHFDDVRYNASLMLGNSHAVTGDRIALPENYKHIGGYHMKEVDEPLPKDLQKLMDESKNGVIYFSMGTMLKSSRIPDHIKRNLLNMFGELKQTVIWKLEQVIPDVPKNVHVTTWAPQQSILGHPNCILFITHGGLLSIMETLSAGVPIIGMPFYADQFLNSERAEARGFGMRIDFDENVAESLRVAIKEMVENPSYRQRVEELSPIFKNNIVTPGQQLSYWVEYVIKTKGAFHLRSPALQVSWYKTIHLDLALVLLLGVILCFKLCECLFRLVRKGESPKKKRS